MLKKIQKILAISIMLIMLTAVTCYAEDVSESITSEAPADVVLTAEEPVKDETAEQVDTEATAVETVGESAENVEITSATTEADATSTDVASDSSSTEMINSDLFLIEETVNQEGIVDGNVYIMGSDVTLNAVVGGDVFVMAKTLTLGENTCIYGNLYALANTIVLDGWVYGGDLYAACSELTISTNAAVNRDVRVLTGKLTFEGGVGRNVYAGVSELIIGESAKIYGDLNYNSTNAAQVPSGVVQGSINFTETANEEKTESRNPVLEYVIGLVSTIVLILAILGLMILFTPKFLKKVENSEFKGILPSLGIGAIGLLGLIIIALPVAILLFISQIGAAAALVVLAIWFLLLFCLSTPVAIISIAGLIANKVEALKKAHNILAIIIASIVVWAIGLIPFVGGLVALLVSLYGFGLIVRIQWKSRKEE